jgi:hypothetical protein
MSRKSRKFHRSRDRLMRRLSSEQPQDQRNHGADDKACNNREIKMKITFGIVDITGQSSKPAFTEPGPQQRANDHHDRSSNYEKFPGVIHSFMIRWLLNFNNCKCFEIDF